MLKKSNLKPNRKKITAKSVHNNFKINFFSQNIELTSGLEDEVPEKPKPGRKKLIKSAESRKDDLVSLLKKKGEYMKIRSNSERFYQKLTNVTTAYDFSQLLIFNQNQLKSIIPNQTNSNSTLNTVHTVDTIDTVHTVDTVDGIEYFPVLNNTPTSTYGFVLVSPNSKFGPFENLAEGSLVFTFLQLEEEKVYFESLNASKLSRTVCNLYSQALVIPNDIFIIYNESSQVTAQIFVVLSKVKWSNADQVKRGKTIPLSQIQ